MYHKWELERGQNTFISLKVREMNATAQEGIEPLPHTYIVENTKGNDYCASHLSAIASICHEYNCLPQKYHTFAKKFVT